jgi:hypothetical protein
MILLVDFIKVVEMYGEKMHFASLGRLYKIPSQMLK